jgi:hypothetical protein
MKLPSEQQILLVVIGTRMKKVFGNKYAAWQKPQ